jgi:type II secretory pathway component PulC
MSYTSVNRAKKSPARRPLRLSAINGMRTLMKNRQTMVVILLVIAVILYLAVDIAYRIIELSTPAPEPEPQTAVGAAAPEMPKAPLEAYTVIVERNLFRTTDRPIVVDEMDPNFLEATTLQLDLCGTIAGEEGWGYAIIEERDKKKQRLYKVADKVGGATIVKIARNAIVLRMGDRDQILKKKEIVSQRADRRPVESPASQPSPASSPVIPPAPAPTPELELPRSAPGMALPRTTPGMELPRPAPGAEPPRLTPGMEPPKPQTYPQQGTLHIHKPTASNST